VISDDVMFSVSSTRFSVRSRTKDLEFLFSLRSAINTNGRSGARLCDGRGIRDRKVNVLVCELNSQTTNQFFLVTQTPQTGTQTGQQSRFFSEGLHYFGQRLPRLKSLTRTETMLKCFPFLWPSVFRCRPVRAIVDSPRRGSDTSLRETMIRRAPRSSQE